MVAIVPASAASCTCRLVASLVTSVTKSLQLQMQLLTHLQLQKKNAQDTFTLPFANILLINEIFLRPLENKKLLFGIFCNSS